MSSSPKIVSDIKAGVNDCTPCLIYGDHAIVSDCKGMFSHAIVF